MIQGVRLLQSPFYKTSLCSWAWKIFSPDLWASLPWRYLPLYSSVSSFHPLSEFPEFPVRTWTQNEKEAASWSTSQAVLFVSPPCVLCHDDHSPTFHISEHWLFFYSPLLRSYIYYPGPPWLLWLNYFCLAEILDNRNHNIKLAPSLILLEHIATLWVCSRDPRSIMD